MYLPDLVKYRLSFTGKGITLPLKAIVAPPEGMLGRLPLPPEGKTGWPWFEETNPAVYRERNDWPKLTIVSPSYNQAGFLEQTIRSVLLQNYPNLEYIIIDGGSTDGSKEIMERYSPWISYWQCERDKGQSNAINQGFSLSSGTYHAWINSDDYYLKNVFHKVIMRFLNTNSDFVYGYGQNFHVESGRLTETQVMPLLDYFIKIPSLIQPSAFWSARIHQPVWEELHCAMDYELWLRLVKGRRRSLIRESLSVANIHDEAKTSDPKMKAKWEEDHQKIWAADAHGTVHEWKRIVFFNRIRVKIYQLIKKSPAGPQ